MALIRVLTPLPSGNTGWYIYHDVNGRLYIDSGDPYNTIEDVKILRDILNKAIEYMEVNPVELISVKKDVCKHDGEFEHICFDTYEGKDLWRCANRNCRLVFKGKKATITRDDLEEYRQYYIGADVDG